LANEVVDCCAGHGIKTAIIGAIAVAVHGYPRSTHDLDLAAAADLGALRGAAKDLEARGCVVTFGEPDFDDPLGGVLTISRGDADPVQIVNYANPFRPGTGALAEEPRPSCRNTNVGVSDGGGPKAIASLDAPPNSIFPAKGHEGITSFDRPPGVYSAALFPWPSSGARR
jgi:hypothetical protein